MKSSRLSIGADPELVLTDKAEKIIKASDILHDRMAKFGVDGHAFTAELRPSPAIHPRDLVSSIKDVLASRINDLKNYVWKAGPWVCEKPLGGHIHFGTPYQNCFKDALDHQFATILAMAEPAEKAAKRRTTIFYGDHPYGQLSDVRTKDWGFEYRTPSSFIVSPGVTLGLITIAKAIIWEELQEGPQAFSKLTDQKELLFEAKDFYTCKREVFTPKLALVRNQLQRMLYFKRNQEGHDLWPTVAYLLKQVIDKGGYSIAGDIKTKWKLVIPEDTKPKSPLPNAPLWRDLLAQHRDWWVVNPDRQEQHQQQFVLNQGQDAINWGEIQINGNNVALNPQDLWRVVRQP